MSYIIIHVHTVHAHVRTRNHTRTGLVHILCVDAKRYKAMTTSEAGDESAQCRVDFGATGETGRNACAHQQEGTHTQ